jgi:hypothetical protein
MIIVLGSGILAEYMVIGVLSEPHSWQVSSNMRDETPLVLRGLRVVR